MSKRKLTNPIFFVPVILMLFAASFQVSAQEAEGIARAGLRPDAPAYGVRGPHLVGTHDFAIEGDPTLDITLWYPALSEGSAEEPIAYPYVIKMDAPPGASATVQGSAILDAAYNLDSGPYPLVVLSHGFILGRTMYAWMAEHLASYGFVVIAPEHREQLDEQMSDFWKSAIRRPRDIHALLDHVDTRVGDGGIWNGLIDAERVAVVGHSLGGYTALALGGARYDIDGLTALCDDARESGDSNAWLCDMVTPYVSDMAELAGYESVPDGLWPSRGDSRVDAIVPMAPDAFFFNEAGLAEISVPVLSMGGTADTGAPYAWGTHPTYNHASSPTKALVAFENAEHMVFGSTCEALPFFAEIGFYTFCSDPVWDMSRAHDLVNHFTTAFLLAELKGDADAAAALAPQAVQFPGITYEAQGF